MPKQYRIKWRESDERELRRVLRNYNAKISRLEKKNPQTAKYLPKYWDDKKEEFTNKLSVNQIKELINTRQDFKRELNALKRFSKKGAEEIVVMPGTDNNIKLTKWQRTEMRRRTPRINKRRQERLKHIEETEMTSMGEPLGYTKAQIGMGRAERISFEPIEISTRTMDYRALNWKWRTIQHESKSDYFTETDYRLRENYIQGIKTHYDYENVKDVINKIEEMPIDEFLNKFYAEGATFEDASPDGKSDFKYQEYVSHEEQLKTIWLPQK